MTKDVDGLVALGREIGSCPKRMIEEIERNLKVRGRDGAVSRLAANRVQRRFEVERRPHNVVLKARQMGITTWVSARFFMKTITAKGVLTVQVAQTREAAEGIFRMVQRFWENLPDDLRTGPLRRSRANVGQMTFPELDSEFRIVSAADPGAGRGLTIQNLHLSEVSRWPGNARETLAGLRAALTPTGEMVIESTPNGAYGAFYEEWQRAATNSTKQHFFPWWLEDAYTSAEATDLTEEEEEFACRNNLSLGQIGFRRGLAASYHGLRLQEFAEDAISCFRATGDCCFEVDAVEKRLAAAPAPVRTARGGALHVWFPAVAEKRYIVAVDTAGGGPDGDFAAVQVIDQATGLQCAELQQRLGPLELARAAAQLAREYNNAVVAVERNNHGSAVLAHLDSTEHYANIYAMNGGGTNGGAGWLTTAGNKPGMVARMGALLVESPAIFQSRRLLEECRTFITMPGGRTGAANGAHDDCVMAMAIAQAVRAELLYR